MTQPNRLLLVEDEPAIARSVEYGLGKEGFAVTWVDTGKRALEAVRSGAADVILLDVRLPDMNGFDVLRQLRAEGKRHPVLMVTARDEETDKVVGLELGADDYIVKPFSMRELASRVRAAMRRAYGELAQPPNEDELRLTDVTVNFTRLTAQRAGEPLWLTQTEYRLLRHLSQNPHIPLARDLLITAVWGYASEIEADRTIDVHIRHLREKLELDAANPRHILTVRGVGYKFEP